MTQAWSYDGVDLTRLGYNVRILEAPIDVQARRGGNLIVPGKTGRAHVTKYFDEKLVTLGMWVKDIPVGGGAASEANMLANLDALKELFGQDGQATLTHTMGGVTREAQAEVASAISFQPVWTSHYRFVVEFILAGGLWRKQAGTVVGPDVIIANPQNMTVDNSGSTYTVRDAIITVTGVITDPRFTIGATYVEWIGTVGNGETLVIDMGEWTCELDGVDVADTIAHSGALCWLPLPAANNTMVVSCLNFGIPAPTIQVDFTEAYL